MAALRRGVVPDDWPIRPLGYWGMFMFVRSAEGEVLAIPLACLNRTRIASLFDAYPHPLQTLWPSESGRHWDADRAAETIWSAARGAGLKAPEELGFRASYRYRRGSVVPTVALLPSP